MKKYGVSFVTTILAVIFMVLAINNTVYAYPLTLPSTSIGINKTSLIANINAVSTNLATNLADNLSSTNGDKIKILAVTPNAPPCNPITVVATNNGPICEGGTATLTATGGVSYLWSNGGTTATTTTAVLTNSDTYTVTATDVNGCTGTASTMVTTNLLPSVSVINAVICQGDCAFLQVTSNAISPTYLWSTGATNSSTNCLTSAGNYTVTVTNTNGCSASTSANVNVVALPSVIITGAATICAGNSATLSATGGSNYFWSTGSTTSAINVSPASTSTYTVTATNNNGCAVTATKTVTVKPLPIAAINGNTGICLGGTTTLTASGGGTYLWSNGSTTSAIVATAVGVYTVTVTGTNGCSATTSTTISNAFTPVITGNTTFCSNSFALLSTSGGGTYTWSNGATLANTAVTSAGTYTVTVTTAAGCMGTASATTTVNTSPTAAANNATICQGDCTTLQVTSDANPGIYLWSTGATATSISTCLNTVGSTNYTVTVTAANGCTVSALANVMVNVLPIVAITGNTSICTGSSTTLTATGGGSYLWSNGGTTSAITVSPPNTTTTYTVTVTSASGCITTASTTVTVGNTFAPTITGNTSICVGSSSTLSTSGGGTYAWSNGATTSTIGVTPSTTSTYTVTITTASGCSGIASATVTVNANPLITTNNATICQGTCANLQANTNSNPATYLWSTGANSTTITPCLTTVGSSTYTVTVTNENGCIGTATANVTVNLAPTAAIAGVTNICFGNVTTLTATGGGSYNWNNGSTTSAINVSPPNASTTYTVTVTNGSACVATASTTVTAGTNLTPIITGNTSICSGSFTILSASGGSSYVWSNGATLANILTTTAGTYTVTITNSSGCTGTGSTTVMVSPSPTVSILGNTSICNENSTILTAIGNGTSYLWNNGNTTSAITITAAGTYTVTVTSENGCTATANKTVTVGSNITPIITGDTNVCLGGSTTLSTSGGGTYLWSNGNTTSAINVTTAGIYSVTVTNTSGCTGMASVVVSNNNITVTATNNGPICAGNAAILTATGGGSYLWNTNATTSSVIVIPINNTTYTVTVSDGGCTATASTTVVVNTDIVAAIVGNTTICTEFTTLTATGGNIFSWSNGSNASTTTVTSAGTYTVTVSNGAGACTATAMATVQVSTLSATIGNIVNPVCNLGGSMKVFVSGGVPPYTGLWSNGATNGAIGNLSGGTYTVTITDATGCSKTASASITDQALGVPTNLTTTNITATTATFNWGAVAGAANYTILGRKVGAATWTTIGPITGTSKTVSSQLVACKNYQWKVRANCASGLTSSSFSAIATFSTTGCPAKADDIAAINQTFSLQPNPASSLVTLNYTSLNNSQLHIMVLDITGKEALSQNTNTTEGDNQIDLHIGNLPPGYYVVEVNDGINKLHEKLIIAR